MISAITVILLTLCSTTLQSDLHKPPLPNYNGQQFPHNIFSYMTTTSRTIRFPEQFFHNVNYQQLKQTPRTPYVKGIQYAPLQTNSREKIVLSNQYFNPTPTASIPYDISTSKHKLYNKEHLEPRTYEEDQTQTQKFNCFTRSPQNVDVLSSASRSPGHNAVYRVLPIVVPRDKPIKASRQNHQHDIKKTVSLKRKALKKMSYMRPYALYENLDVPIPATISPLIAQLRQAAINEQKALDLDPTKIEKDNGLESSKLKRQQQYSPYSKFHRLHLNIGRVYSPGQVPLYPPENNSVYAPQLESMPGQPNVYLPPVFHSLSDRKAEASLDQERRKKILYRLV